MNDKKMILEVSELDELRKEIDEVDEELLKTLCKRMSLVEAVGKFKKTHGLLPLDQKRWKIVLKNRVKWGNLMKLSPHFIQNVFEAIHEEALIIEAKHHE